MSSSLDRVAASHAGGRVEGAQLGASPRMRFSALVSVVFSIGLGAFATSSASADTVKLKNGDTLTGKVVSILDGKVTLTTAAAGEIKIDLAQVETLATDDEIEVELATGSKFKGKASAAEGGAFTVETTDVGKQTVAISNVGSVNKPAKPPRAWTGSIVGSSTWTRGNTSTQQASLDINAVNRGEIDRLTFDGWYRAGRQKDQSTGVTATTERRFGGGLKYDYFFTEKAYWYANATAEKNAIAALDLRFVAGGGLGWQFIEDECTHLNVEGGASWFSENYSNGTSSVDAVAARIATHLTHKFSDTVSFFNDNEVYKIFGDPRDYLVKTKGGFKQTFTPTFFAQEWVEFDWDPTPAAGKKRSDVTYFLGIGWTF